MLLKSFVKCPSYYIYVVDFFKFILSLKGIINAIDVLSLGNGTLILLIRCFILVDGFAISLILYFLKHT